VRAFEIKVNSTASLTHVALFGELDLSREDEFEDAVNAIQSGRLLLDLRGVTFVDSAGLQMILRAWQRSREDGFALEIVGAHSQVEQLLRITGLEGVLPIVDPISLNGDLPHVGKDL
jgi:anti-sigma B factor antagonist